MGWLRKRFGEASTHAGVAIGFQIASTVFPQYSMLLQALSACFIVPAVAIPN